MALMKCSKCGKEISDKAKSCVHCGASLEKKEKKICPECGKVLKDNKCNNCGYLNNNSNNNNKITTNNNNNQNINQSTSFFSITLKTIIGGVLIWCVISFLTYGDIFGSFGGKGKIIDSTLNTSSGTLQIFKSGKCELYNLGLTSDNCTWKLNGKELRVNYSFASGKVTGTIKGKFNENFSRFTEE